MLFKGRDATEKTTVVAQDELDEAGLTRQDEADMAEQGKRQQFNVRKWATESGRYLANLESGTLASGPHWASQRL